MEKEEIIYWENLEIPIEDFLEEEKSNKINFTRKIYNRLKHQSPNWLKSLGINSNDEKIQIENLRQIYSRNNLPIIRAYCCSWFAYKMDNLQLLTKFADSILSKSENTKFKGDDDVLCFLLYGKNKRHLVDLYYENFLQRIQTDIYRSNSTIPYTQNITLNPIITQRLLDKYERKKKIKKQKSKVWWFKEDSTSWTIVFRRLRLKGVPIKLLDSNKFVRTADLKAFKIDKNLLISQLYTKKEPQTMIKCIEFIVKEISNLQVTYSKQERIHENRKVSDFIGRVENKINGIILLEIGFRNFPLRDSPTLILRSQDNSGVHNPLNQLRAEGKSPSNDNCIYMKVKKGDMKFDIKFDKAGNNTGISLNYRGLPQKSREEILKFIDEQFE